MEIMLQQFLILELEKGNWSTPSSGHFSAEQKAFGIIGREMCKNLFI
jgi:hypothetical protein